ncbi:uncharacterized protein LOC131848436 [Achroia grisella]|uniref:uncharacterized protein LOC131848436 n=1 Tax=Achroia grisella TaxID=688607 RepID=UPI0027D333CD|nr:uncharacterized protein LOC131848436 [Achroia grisella]
MQLLFILIIAAFIEARKRRPVHLDLVPVPQIAINAKESHIPVFFDHIYEEGFEDPMSDLKQPVDILELTLETPKSKEEKRMYLQMKSPKNIIYVKQKEEPLSFLSPRDEFLYYSKKHNRKSNKKLDETANNKTNIDDTPKFYNFEYLQAKNLVSPPKKVIAKPSPEFRVDNLVSNRVAKQDLISQKMGYFTENKFDLKILNKDDKLNWTTCDQFGYDLHFHPRDIIGLDWVPFFTWSSKPYLIAVTHKFSYPTAKTVEYFKKHYGPYLDKVINWNEPKILLKENRDILLVSLNRKGTFYAIPSQPLSSGKRVSLPVIKIQLKILDPYLVMMYCDDHYATIMAVSGDEPDNDYDKKAEAAKLNFSGMGYPVSRDIKEEALRLAMIKEQKLLEENMKYIKTIEVHSIPKERF